MDNLSPAPPARLGQLEAFDTMVRMAVVASAGSTLMSDSLDASAPPDDLSELASVGSTPPLPQSLSSLSPLPPLFMTGAELRRLRVAVGLSQRELAEALDYSRDVVWRWETHDLVIPRAMMAHILDRLMEARRQLEAWRQQRAEMLQWTPPPQRAYHATNTRPRRNKTAPPPRTDG